MSSNSTASDADANDARKGTAAPAHRYVEHVFECCQLSSDELEQLPSCGKHSQCAISCLQMWFAHAAACGRCCAHLDQFPRCSALQCRRMSIMLDQQRQLAQLLAQTRLKVTGYVFEKALQTVTHLLQNVDYANLHYVPPRQSRKSCLHTILVFRLLACLMSAQARLSAPDSGMSVDGHDLVTLMDAYVDTFKSLETQSDR